MSSSFWWMDKSQVTDLKRLERDNCQTDHLKDLLSFGAMALRPILSNHLYHLTHPSALARSCLSFQYPQNTPCLLGTGNPFQQIFLKFSIWFGLAHSIMDHLIMLHEKQSIFQYKIFCIARRIIDNSIQVVQNSNMEVIA